MDFDLYGIGEELNIMFKNIKKPSGKTKEKSKPEPKAGSAI